MYPVTLTTKPTPVSGNYPGRNPEHGDPRLVTCGTMTGDRAFGKASPPTGGAGTSGTQPHPRIGSRDLADGRRLAGAVRDIRYHLKILQKTRGLVLEVRDHATGELLRRIPPEGFRREGHAFTELRGAIIDQRA